MYHIPLHLLPFFFLALIIMVRHDTRLQAAYAGRHTSKAKSKC